jgi:hypothetical protein
MKTHNLFFSSFICATSVLFFSVTMRAQDASPAASAPSTSASSSSSQTSDTEWDGVNAELLSVTRGEGDITIKFKYTNSGAKDVELYQSNYGHDNLAALVYYIDPKNKKKYSVIRDAEQKPVASLMQSIKLEAGASKTGWCKLPAPPADTTNITVVIPGTAPFEKVRVATQ